MTFLAPRAICRWFGPLSIGLISIVAVISLSSPSHRWRPNEVTEAPYGNDFLQEWIGGYMILHGEADKLYDSRIFELRQHDPECVGFQWSRATYFPPVYPPPHYLLSTAISWIPYRWASVIWQFCLGLAMILGCWIAAKHVIHFEKVKVDTHLKQTWERWTWIAIILFPSTIFCFLMGQKGPFWLLILAASWGLLRNKRDGWAGLVFGLLSIKPTLFFLLPIVMLRYRRWRFLIGCCGTSVVLWGGAFAILPLNVWSGFAEKLGMAGNYASIQGYHLDWSCNLMALSQIAGHPIDACLVKWWVVVPLALFGLWIVIEPKKLELDHPKTLLNIGLVTFLLSPHAYYYDLVILLVPILWYTIIDLKRSFYYFSGLTAAIVLAPQALTLIGIPAIPILLMAALIELRSTERGFKPLLSPTTDEDLEDKFLKASLSRVRSV